MTLDGKSVFLLDGAGALLSLLLLGLVLPLLQTWVGMPINVLFLLAVWALGYGIYSFSCYGFAKNRRFWLRNLIIANLVYCAATLGLVIFHYEVMTLLGMVYFGLEAVVIFAVVSVEVWVYRKIKPSS